MIRAGKSGIIVLLSAILFSSGCYLLWEHYRSDEHKFSISLPRFWEHDSETGANIVVSIREPLQGGNDKFQENINVTVLKVSKDTPLDILFDVNKEAVLRGLQGAKYDVVEDEIYAGRDLGKLLAFNFNQQGLKLKIISAMWVKNSLAYVVTASCETDKYPRYKKTFEEVMASLRLDN